MAVERFLGVLPELSRDEFGDHDALAVTLQRVTQAARESWPGVEVDDATFAGYLAARAQSGLAGLESLCTGDLYLACACAHEQREALVAVERKLLRPIVRRLADSTENVDELTQMFLLRLVVRPERGAARIEQYSGRGSLRAWMRVAVLRRLQTLRGTLERRQQTAPLTFDLLCEAGAEDPELDRVRSQFGTEFGASFAAAADQLSAHDRRVLRQHHLQGLTLAQIGDIYGVHRVTAARHLAKARTRLLEATRQELAARLGLEGTDFQGAVALILSRVELSLDRLLASHTHS